MNEKNKRISKKTRRFLSALFSLYILLCFVFCGLLRHIVDCSATGGVTTSSYEIVASAGNSSCYCQVGVNNGRGCFLKLETQEEIEFCSSVMGFNTNGGKIWITSPYNSQTYTQGAPSSNIGFAYYTTGSSTNSVNNKLSEIGSLPSNFTSFCRVFPFFSQDNKNVTWDFRGNVPYVTSWNDAYKYLVEGNDNVIVEGDPDNPPVLQDNTLPVPQQLTCNLHNSYTASNPFIEGSWQNPANASWDAIKQDVKIHIQYKPNFQYYKRFLDVKAGSRQANQFIDLGVYANYDKNSWINTFPNIPTDSIKSNIIHFTTLKDDMESVARMVGSGEEFYPAGATLLNGTQWRVRYELSDGRVSYWAVYGVNSIGKLKSKDSVSFQDNNNDNVSSDAVAYNDSFQTDPDNYNGDNSSLLGKLRNALNNIEALPSTMQNVASEGSSYANFLKKIFEKFPEIYVIFTGGLIIAIFLRIFGR